MPNDDNDKSNVCDSDDSSDDDVAGPNRNHPALMRQDTGKGESKRGGKKQELPSRKAGKTVTFGEGTKFMAAVKKKVDTVIIVHIKVSKSSVTDEICMKLYSHANTCVLRK